MDCIKMPVVSGMGYTEDEGECAVSANLAEMERVR